MTIRPSTFFIILFFLLLGTGLRSSNLLARDREFLKIFRMDSPGNSMENVPVTHQRGIPLCYAFAAAQMVDAIRFTYDKDADVEYLTSPLAAAVGASYDTHLTYFETLNYGGFLCEAVESLLKYGSCLESKTRKLFDNIKSYQDNSEELKKLLGAKFRGRIFRSQNVDSIFDEANIIMENYSMQIWRGNRMAKSKKRNQFLQKNFDGMISSLKELGISDEFLPKKKEDFISTNGNGWSQMTILKNLVERACGDEPLDLTPLKISCKEKQRKDTTIASGKLLLSNIQNEMSKTKMATPVGIKYCANFLEDGPKYRGLADDNNGRLQWNQECLIHYSLVIGYKDKVKIRAGKKNIKRQYLIRDSYGDDCGGSSLHPSFVCDKGNIWVDEKILENNILEITLLTSEPL